MIAFYKTGGNIQVVFRSSLNGLHETWLLCNQEFLVNLTQKKS